MIEFKHVSKRYGDFTAVRDVSLSVSEGETLALLGTSGSGKTTLLRMANRLVKPSEGTITVQGESIGEQKPYALRRSMGYVIQNHGLFPHFSVAENIAVVPRLLGWERTKIDKRVDELLQLLGLDPEIFRSRAPSELSGGQKQRISVARALAADPPVILLDEPFGALDPLTRHDIQSQFKSLKPLIRKTTILVTHDVLEAAELGDRICVLDGGEIQQLGTAEELYRSPANTFVKDFIRPFSFQLALASVSLESISEKLRKEIEAAPQAELRAAQSLYDAVNISAGLPASAAIRVTSDESSAAFTTSAETVRELAFQLSSGRLDPTEAP